MPTYDYQCEKCPQCGDQIKRLIGTGADIIFKGSGFYATDHRKGYKKTYCDGDSPCCGRQNPCEKSSRSKQ